MSAAIDGHEKSSRFDPAVLRVKTFVYRFDGTVGVAGTVTDPKTCMNYTRTTIELSPHERSTLILTASVILT